MHEGKARMDEQRRALRLGGAQRPSRRSNGRPGKILPGVAIVQQRVRLLPGHVDVDISGRGSGAVNREQCAQLGRRSSKGHGHGDRCAS